MSPSPREALINMYLNQTNISFFFAELQPKWLGLDIT
jgi:hypothetical protein